MGVAPAAAVVDDGAEEVDAFFRDAELAAVVATSAAVDVDLRLALLEEEVVEEVPPLAAALDDNGRANAVLPGFKGRILGNPKPGTTMPQFFANTTCISCTSKVLEPRCCANRMDCRVTFSKKSSAICKTCSSASASIV